jgi:hypothetical protein
MPCGFMRSIPLPRLPASFTLPPMRLRYLLLAMSGVVVASSACSTDATSPLPLAAPGSAGFSKGPSRPSTVYDAEGSDDVYTFQINPLHDNYLTFGEHSLWLPAHSVCDPTTSSYGMGTWNDACAPLTTSITITAKVRSASGGLPRVDFEPALRFNPATATYLTLTVKGKQAKEAAEMRVLYCPTSSSKDCVDEALTDPTLKTVLDRSMKMVYRRIKHFSGYLVAERTAELSELY